MHNFKVFQLFGLFYKKRTISLSFWYLASAVYFAINLIIKENTLCVLLEQVRTQEQS